MCHSFLQDPTFCRMSNFWADWQPFGTNHHGAILLLIKNVKFVPNGQLNQSNQIFTTLTDIAR